MKAIFTRLKQPHELEIGEWCIYNSGIYACCPGDLVANLSAHTITIEADGDILTVFPSILVNGAPGETWHGYIRNGIWLGEDEQPIKV